MDVNVEIIYRDIGEDCSEDRAKPISWHRVLKNDEEIYRRTLHWTLQGIDIPDVSECSDLNCYNEGHIQQIDRWSGQLVECCLEADRYLPRVKLKKSNKPYKTDSIWWHNIWKQYGQPKQGVVYDSKTEAHRQYMYATKRNKKKVEQLRRERMNEAICENRSRDLFNEMKKLNPKASLARCIDGHVETIDIAEYLAGKYYDIYNYVPSDEDNKHAESKRLYQ